MKINQQYVYQTIHEIMAIDSPSGFCQTIIKHIEKYITNLGYQLTQTNKGNAIISMEGQDTSKTVAIAAHVDTLGLMVRSIKANGRLAITTVGGPNLATLDSENVRIYTREQKVYTGTIFSTSSAVHVYKDASTKERNLDNLEIILDEVVSSKEEVVNLGINNGDYICFDTKTMITESGFIKSRFLDDKLSVAMLLSLLRFMKDENIKPKYNTKIMITTHEEVGHGLAHFPSGIDELLCVDMGCIGLDLNCSEFDVSICAKDSSGPYHYEMTNQLIDIAKKLELSYAVDIYPFYGSDASAALRAGHDIKTALIGAGVFASHGYERTHYQAVENTIKLIYGYLVEE